MGLGDGPALEEPADGDRTGRGQQAGADRDEQDEGERLGADRDRPAAAGRHAPRRSDRGHEGGDPPAAAPGAGPDHEARRRLPCDREHDPVLEAVGRPDRVGRRERFQLARHHERVGQLGVRRLRLTGGARRPQLGRIEAAARPGHAAPPGSTVERRRWSPRRSWVLTVPSGRSVWRAISSSWSSPKKRRVTTSRYGSGNAATAPRRSAARSPRTARSAGSFCPAAATDRASSAAAAGSVRSGSAGSGRIDPGDGPPAAGLAERDAHRDPGQPCPERSFAAPARERAIRGHERFLGRILGLVQVAEDAVAGANDRRRFALHEQAVGVAITGQHGIDDRPLIAGIG